MRGKLRREWSIRHHLTGIGQGMYKTKGNMNLQIFGRTVKFHLVRANFPISTCGILGTEFLRENSASLKFTEQNTTLDLPDASTTNPCIITLPSRTKKLITLSVANSHLSEGYLRKVNAGKGIFIGKNLVTSENGFVKLFAINTTLCDIEITIPPVELLEFETLSQNDKSNEASESDGEAEKKRADRLSKLLNIFDFSELNDEEKASLLGPISENTHRFYLEGDVFGVHRRSFTRNTH